MSDPQRHQPDPPDPDHLAGLAPASVLVAAGRPARTPGASVSPPLELTSTYVATDAGVAYGRNGNATWTAFEDALGALEGGRALSFASGMGAISAAMSLVAPGGTIVAPTSPYNLTTALLQEYAAAGHEVRTVDIADTTAVLDALDGAALVWTESPTNPLLDVADLSAIFASARARGVVSVCDNTLATPLLQRPLALGADVVVHSVTKYLAGHSDVLLGAVVTADDGRYDVMLRRRTLHGAIPGPMEAWLALRGLRTLDVRLVRACQSAAELAARLSAHPGVERVRYPGSGAMVSIDVRGGAAAADAATAAVRLWTHATSLGGVESLVERRRKYPAESHAVPEGLLRLSVGIEDVEDLWRDLDAALRAD